VLLCPQRGAPAIVDLTAQGDSPMMRRQAGAGQVRDERAGSLDWR